MTIEVLPATGRFDDVERILGPGPAARGACWCLSYRNSTVPDRAGYVRELCASEPGPGVLAYVDGEVAGWCSVSPRAEYRRLVNSRTIPTVDDRPVWSIVCFVVRPGYRRQGVARALLDGAIEFARENGAETLEGYPVDPEGERVEIGAAYVGTTGMFEDAGFTRVLETNSHSGHLTRWLMRRDV